MSAIPFERFVFLDFEASGLGPQSWPIEIGRQSITSDDPAANTDARVVDVIVTFDAASSPIAAPFTNLETVVRIDAGPTP